MFSEDLSLVAESEIEFRIIEALAVGIILVFNWTQKELLLKNAISVILNLYINTVLHSHWMLWIQIVHSVRIYPRKTLIETLIVALVNIILDCSPILPIFSIKHAFDNFICQFHIFFRHPQQLRVPLNVQIFFMIRTQLLYDTQNRTVIIITLSQLFLI